VAGVVSRPVSGSRGIAVSPDRRYIRKAFGPGTDTSVGGA